MRCEEEKRNKIFLVLQGRKKGLSLRLKRSLADYFGGNLYEWEEKFEFVFLCFYNFKRYCVGKFKVGSTEASCYRL